MTRRTNRGAPRGPESLESRRLLRAYSLFVPTDSFRPAEVRGFNPQPDPPGPAAADVSGVRDQAGGEAAGLSPSA